MDDLFAPASQLVTADFNGDGFPDVAGVLPTQQVAVALNDGTPFAAPRLSSRSSNAPIAAGDVNQDGKQDVVSTASGKLVTLLGNGDGTFSSPADGPVSLGEFIALGDVNGDGKPDAVNVYPFLPPGQLAPLLSLHLGDGNGGFADAGQMSLNTGGYAVTDLVLTDLNGDGRADLVVQRNQNEVYLSTGSSFAMATTILGGRVAVGRLNGDAIPDLVVDSADSDSLLQLYAGNGDGTFTSIGSRFTRGDRAFIADFDNDGVNDILSAGAVLEVSRGLGNAAFAEPVLTAGASGSFVVGDFDRDGKRDVATPASFFQGNGDGTFREDRAYSTRDRASLKSAQVSASDINGDGRPDATTVVSYPDTAAEIAVRLNDGNGGLLAPLFTTTGLTSFPGSFLVGGLNGDAYPDAVVITSTEVKTFLGRGDGTFSAGSSTTFSSNILSPAQLADLNGDGAADLLVGYDIYEGNSDGSFDPRRSTSLNYGVIGDLDRNGTVDVVWYNASTTEMRFVPNRGGGVFNSSVVVGTNAGQPLTTGDFDGDGFLDILTSYFGERIHVFRGKGDGTFHAPVATLYSGLATNAVLYVADVNGDGDLDVVQRGLVLLGNGDGRFRAVESTGIDAWSASADFNHDGQLDLLSASAGVFTVNLTGLAPEPALSSTTAVTVPSPLEHATGATFNTTVTGTRQGVRGFVLYTIDGVPFALAEAVRADGEGALSTAIVGRTLSFAKGAYELTATFLGNATHRPSSVTTPLTVDRATTSLFLPPSYEASYSTAPRLTWLLNAPRDPFLAKPLVAPPNAFTVTDNGAPHTDLLLAVAGNGGFIRGLGAGTHAVTVSYPGDANYKPASATTTISVLPLKGSFGYFEILPADSTRLAGPVKFRAQINTATHDYGAVTGTIQFLVNEQSVGTVPLTLQEASITVNLPAGAHRLEMRYSGDANITGAQTSTIVPVYLPAGSPVASMATPAPSGAFVQWVPVSGVSSYAVFQRTTYTAGWQHAGTFSGFAGATIAMAEHTTRMFAVAPVLNGSVGAIGPADLVTRITFTNDPVVPGTMVQAAHVTELRTAVNAVRTFAGLSAYPFTDSTLTNHPRAVHFTELREALTQARNAIAMPMTFGTAPATGAPVRSTHIEELRAGVR